MAKSVKNIVQEFNKNISRREASRKAQNERRKLQRRLAQELTRQTDEKVTWKEATSFYEGSKVESSIASRIYSDIGKLQYKREKTETDERIGYGVEISDIQERIIIEYPTAQAQKRKNEMFKRDINQSTKVDNVTNLKAIDTHGFYAATYEAWKNVDVESDRNKAIMDTFGVNDLKSIYKLITDKELDFEEFGFEDEGLFKEWLEEIQERVDLKKLREIYRESMQGLKDEPDTKYDKFVIQNIKNRSSDVYASD